MEHYYKGTEKLIPSYDKHLIATMTMKESGEMLQQLNVKCSF
jgi:hypothetical protein